MKKDLGFWDISGNYIEDLQEVEMLSVKELNEIELIKGQNEGLKKQNAELQKQIKKYAKINEQETKDYAQLKAENEQLKSQLDFEVQKKEVLETKLNEFADKFDCINDYVDEVHIHYEDETGGCCGIEDAIWGFELVKLQELLRDFTDFVEEIK